MDKRYIFKIIINLIIPPIMVIVLFVVSIGAIFIPATEDTLMKKKQEIIQAIVISATSIIEKHAEMEQQGIVTREESQLAALMEMRALRYGVEKNDYLWIIDLQPNMVMHPYFPELEGEKLDEYRDLEGRLFFVETADLARENGKGYIEYMWPKEYNLEAPLPKLSYIQLFEPWGWVVGSGVYLDDVQAEIKAVTFRLLVISSGIGLVVVALLIWMIYRGLKSEKGRRLAKKEVLSSRERYKALAHASGEMIFLTIDGRVTAANKKACDILGYNEDEMTSHSIVEFFVGESGKDIVNKVQSGENITAVETFLNGNNGYKHVFIYAEHTVVNEKSAVLYTAYSFNYKADSEDSIVLQELIKKSGFGILMLKTASKGKIIKADENANNLLNKTNDKSIIGTDLSNIFYEEDANRFLTQLQMDKKVENMLLRFPISVNEIKYFRAWAAIIEENRNAKEPIMVLLKDETQSKETSLAIDSLLTELLSPKTTLANTMFNNDAFIENSIHQQFMQDKVILAQSIKMGLKPQKILHNATHSINSLFEYAVEKAFELIGLPPCPYALLALGSIGRMEPTLSLDQDTAIIYEAGENDKSHSKYFYHFGEAVTSICAGAGISPCVSGNTAANKEWCMNEIKWQHQFTKWINTSQPEDLLKVNTFFDFRTLAGDKGFAVNLRENIFQTIKKRPVFLFNLAQNTLEYAPPSDFIGRIRTDNGAGNYVNLKGTMLHFVNFARIYALQNSIHETNTIKRIQTLEDIGCLPSDIVQDTIDAWIFLMELRLKNQIKSIDMNFSQENFIMLGHLSSWEKTMLKKAMGQVQNLQRRLSTDIARTE